MLRSGVTTSVSISPNLTIVSAAKSEVGLPTPVGEVLLLLSCPEVHALCVGLVCFRPASGRCWGGPRLRSLTCFVGHLSGASNQALHPAGRSPGHNHYFVRRRWHNHCPVGLTYGELPRAS